MRWQQLVAALAIGMVAASPARAQDKGKGAKAEAKAEKRKDEKQEEKKNEKKGEKKDEHAEHKAFSTAEDAPGHLLKGIKLTDAEEKQVKAIRQKYRAQLTDLRKTHEAAEKAGKEDDSQIGAKIQAIADQERAELRAA